ncbi:MAG: ribonuclease HII [Desulfobacteraceae bacterium]|nr:ribonuclease HII [Desulfobacteraceae bacterium]
MGIDLWTIERAVMAKGYTRIAGVDEAGRGPLAGPVVSAAVILPPTFNSPEVNDSKQLSERQRERLFDLIQAEAETVGVGLIEAAEIDGINIFQAARRSMAMAVANLTVPPDYLLIDGKFGIPSDLPQEAIIKGDSRSISIAAASIIAKVTRDRLMLDYHDAFPQYGFDRHKGYPTKAHKEAVARHGPSAIHRLTFRGVKEHLAGGTP